MEPLDPKADTRRPSTFVSFRDPGGQVVIANERVFRLVSEFAWGPTAKFLHSQLASELIAEGKLIQTNQVDNETVEPFLNNAVKGSDTQAVLEHRQVKFPSYPYEWSAEMLFAAGELTLDLMDRLLRENYGLKDASPYNVLFNGPNPIFIDFLSIEERDPRDPTWLAYAQFVRTFIRPLLANKYFGLGLDQTFRVYRDGLQPEHLYRMSSLRQKVHPSFLTSVSLPALLSRMNPARYQQIYQPRKSGSAEQAHFILHRQVRGLRKKLKASSPDPKRQSSWINYEETDNREESYIPFKATFIEKTLNEHKLKNVLDVGCNRGHFSLLAAQSGCSVVAIDQDAVVVGALWRLASQKKLDILPLVIDITRPTGGLGWRNRETRGFLDRALGTFDCVFMLAVIHHMLVTERIPLTEILQLAWELTKDRLIIEWVDPSDRMFKLLTRGNQDLYNYLTPQLFEKESSTYFQIQRKELSKEGSRCLYEMRRRDRLA